MVTAGLLAFAIAAAFSSGAMDTGASRGNVVEPAERVNAPPKRTDVAPFLVLNQQNAPNTDATSKSQGSGRLGNQVTHNPFGPLNLKAGAATLGEPAAPLKTAYAPPAKKTNVKPAEPATSPPPPPPVAPPLPFVAVGSIAGAQVTNGQQVAFIRRQDQLMLIRTGDSIGQTYRVESITEQKIEFTYLPLMQRQALALAP